MKNRLTDDAVVRVGEVKDVVLRSDFSQSRFKNTPAA
jgi:hypothetical protein